MIHDRAIEEAILAELDADGLAELSFRVGDVYPTTLRDSVGSLVQRNRLPALVGRRLTLHRAEVISVCDEDLPVPHPLDGDWRLEVPTRKDMCRRLRAASLTGEILLLGVPTIFREIVSEGARVTLVDANTRLATSLMGGRFIIGDVSDLAPVVPACASVFADPPWYPETIDQFVWYASESTLLGGHVFLSMPGLLTRPGIEAERSHLLHFAAKCGLRLRGIERRALRYESPPFERASLSAAGLPGFPRSWRHGDLAEFDKVSVTAQQRPAKRSRPRWIEHVVRGVSIRFRVRPEPIFNPKPILLGPSRVRLTVSARDPLISLVDVWTSGNQIYRCDSPLRLARLAESFEELGDGVAMIETDVGRKLLAHERILVDQARSELGRVVSTDFTRLEVRSPALP